MKKTEFIKCRITPQMLSDVDKAALRAGATTSDVMRVAIAQVVEGHSLDATVRADTLAVRVIANVILAWADNSGLDGDGVRELTDAGERLRAVAARHLRPAS